MKQYEQHYFKIYEPSDNEDVYSVYLLDRKSYETGIQFNSSSMQGSELNEVLESFGLNEIHNGFYEMSSKTTEKYIRNTMQTLGFLEMV